MDGNVAALNEHLAQQADKDYENNWKRNYIDECVETSMLDLELKLLEMIDAICEIEGEAKKIFNEILFKAVFSNESKAVQAFLQEKVQEELATWVDAEEAYEQHVKDNEPQEP